jgi:hypothetical protein
MFALVMALKEWRPYLEERHVTVYTDHHALQYLQRQHQLSRRQARWLETIQSFGSSLDIQYKPSKTNPADGLSCRPDLAPAVTIQWHEEHLDALRRGYVEDPAFVAAPAADKARQPDGLYYYKDTGRL